MCDAYNFLLVHRLVSYDKFVKKKQMLLPTLLLKSDSLRSKRTIINLLKNI